MTQIELLMGHPHQRFRSELGPVERRGEPVLPTRYLGIQLPLWPNKHAEVKRIRTLSHSQAKRV